MLDRAPPTVPNPNAQQEVGGLRWPSLEPLSRTEQGHHFCPRSPGPRSFPLQQHWFAFPLPRVLPSKTTSFKARGHGPSDKKEP
jgi:hypothetical protein